MWPRNAELLAMLAEAGEAARASARLRRDLTAAHQVPTFPDAALPMPCYCTSSVDVRVRVMFWCLWCCRRGNAFTTSHLYWALSISVLLL